MSLPSTVFLGSCRFEIQAGGTVLNVLSQKGIITQPIRLDVGIYGVLWSPFDGPPTREVNMDRIRFNVQRMTPGPNVYLDWGTGIGNAYLIANPLGMAFGFENGLAAFQDPPDGTVINATVEELLS